MIRQYKERACEACGSRFMPTGCCAKWCDDCRSPVARRIPGCCAKCEKKLRQGERVLCKKCITANPPSHVKSPGIGSGNAQGFGEDHHTYKSGIEGYKRQRRASCERCGSKRFLLVHHKDRDRYNNKLANLETLCKSCHQKEHEVWKNFLRSADAA